MWVLVVDEREDSARRQSILGSTKIIGGPLIKGFSYRFCKGGALLHSVELSNQRSLILETGGAACVVVEQQSRWIGILLLADWIVDRCRRRKAAVLQQKRRVAIGHIKVAFRLCCERGRAVCSNRRSEKTQSQMSHPWSSRIAVGEENRGENTKNNI